MIKYIGNINKNVAILCDNFKIFYEIQNILKKRKITAVFDIKREFYDAIIYVLEKPSEKRLLKEDNITKLYTTFKDEINFLLDYISVVKGFFIQSIKIGIDPGLHNIGIVVVAENVFVIGETYSDAEKVINILSKITKYQPKIKNILIKIGNGINYNVLLRKIQEITEKKMKIIVEIVDEKIAKQQVVLNNFLKDRDVTDAYKILISKSYSSA